MNKAEHTFKWVIDTEATATQTGSKHEECTVCGYKKDAVEIPATGTNEAPATGDTSNYSFWVILTLASGICLICIVAYRRKQKENR